MSKKAVLASIATVLSGLMVTAVSADVVLSGRLIGSVENIRGGGSKNTDANGNTIFVPRTRFNDESSYVRISGIEKLGNSGVAAGFQIESGFDLSGGSASGDNFGTVNSGNSTRGIATRNSGVFMQGGFGKVLFGRWDVFYDTIYLIEPSRNSLPNKVSLLSIFNTPNGGAQLIARTDNNGNITSIWGPDSNLGDRYNNVLSYYTPDLAGLKVQLAYVPTNESSTIGRRYDGRIYMGTLTYTPDYLSFPLTLMASGFQQRADLTTTGQSPTAAPQYDHYRLTALRGGAAVKLPLAEGVNLHIGAIYQFARQAVNTTADTITYSHGFYGIPLALMLGSNTFYATYGRANNTEINGPHFEADGSFGSGKYTYTDSHASFIMVGYNYDISKRTAIGAYFTQIGNGSSASYDFYVNGLNNSGNYGGSLNSITGTATASISSGVKPRAMGVSFRHLF